MSNAKPMPDAKEITLLDLQALFPDEDAARKYLEGLRWPNGPACPHCATDPFLKDTSGPHITPYPIQHNKDRKVRAGLYGCPRCKGQFTVTVGTVMESSHLPLRVWIAAFYLMMASKTGISALALQRHLKIGSYRSAWFLCHRVRHCLKQGATLLTGTVEADEVYIGGPPRKINNTTPTGPKKKIMAVGLVERGGDVRLQVRRKAETGEIRRTVKKYLDPSATLYSDEHHAYRKLGRRQAKHETVHHSRNEYVRGDVHTNTIEGFFGLIQTGIIGVYHGVGKQHLQRYADEYVYRYNARKLTDGERFQNALKLAPGCRLTLEQPKRRASG